MLASNMRMPKERLASTLGLARATVDRKIRDDKLLSPDESSRMLGMASLIGQVQSLVAESGRAWATSTPARGSRTGWSRPVPALGGRRPAELMDTSGGARRSSRGSSPRCSRAPTHEACLAHRFGHAGLCRPRPFRQGCRDDRRAAGTGRVWPVVYAAATASLAALETIVHFGAAGLPLNRFLVRIDVPDDLWDARGSG